MTLNAHVLVVILLKTNQQLRLDSFLSCLLVSLVQLYMDFRQNNTENENKVIRLSVYMISNIFFISSRTVDITKWIIRIKQWIFFLSSFIYIFYLFTISIIMKCLQTCIKCADFDHPAHA